MSYRVHGLDLSYFTGKLEAGLRLKGLPYTLVEMDSRSFRRLGDRVGVRQMPHLESPDGDLLTDSFRILDRLDALHPETLLRPAEPLAAFCDALLEYWADEWLWRPALHYRWWPEQDAALLSRRLAEGLLRDVPLPLFVKRRLILARQRRTYLAGDGITATTAPAVEALFEATLAALAPHFAAVPFLAGARPTRADAALMGPFFRHFSSDPTPRARLEAAAPALLAWVDRTWNAGPVEGPLPVGIPPVLAALAADIAGEFLPAMAANLDAAAIGARRLAFLCRGTRFETPVSPYRAMRLADLQQRWRALPGGAQEALSAVLGTPGVLAVPTPLLPPRPRLTDRGWRPLGAA
jgi:glutathione S-transferase